MVNLFSIPQCSKVLSLERDDMQWLLKKYCGVELSMLGSRADWRYGLAGSVMTECDRWIGCLWRTRALRCISCGTCVR